MGGLVVLLRVAMPPKKRPGELLCFFGTKDPGRRTALSKCHAKADFGSQRRWMSLDEIVDGTVGVGTLCPVSLPRTRAYYGRVPGIPLCDTLWSHVAALVLPVPALPLSV